AGQVAAAQDQSGRGGGASSPWALGLTLPPAPARVAIGRAACAAGTTGGAAKPKPRCRAGFEGAMSETQAVLFLHGIGGAGRVWAGQAASFAAAGFAPLAPDLLGYGGRPPVTAMDFAGLAEDAEAFLARHAALQPVLVGHSMGGMVAQTM